MRKEEMAKALDLREKRQAAGISQERMGELLDRDPKHLSKIENGKVALTMVLAAKLAKEFGSMVVEVDGIGRVMVAPAPDNLPKVTTTLRPGEAAWIAIEESQEAVESAQEIQKAIIAKNRERLVMLCEQAVCDPIHAAGLLKASMEKYDPSIVAEAYQSHTAKLLGKGFSATC